MKIQFALNKQQMEKVDASLTLTMSLGDWSEMQDQLSSQRWPSSELYSAIEDCIRAVNKQQQGEV